MSIARSFTAEKIMFLIIDAVQFPLIILHNIHNASPDYL